jgi:cytochrome c oxidase subunit 3
MQTEATVAVQFHDAAQQRDAATLGMWVFLATEVLFFGGMFLAYTVYRIGNPRTFLEASNHTLVAVGAVNTAVLLVSSFTMVLGVKAAEERRSVSAGGWLALTAALGAAFLVVKGFEYRHEIHEGLFPGAGFHYGGLEPERARMFFYLYFLMTAVHALHVAIGVCALGWFSLRSLFTLKAADLSTAVDVLGLYWHFVDLVWVFLFPLLYLAGRSL